MAIFTEAGLGRKQCPACKNFVGVRTGKCPGSGCNHVFEAGHKAKPINGDEPKRVKSIFQGNEHWNGSRHRIIIKYVQEGMRFINPSFRKFGLAEERGIVVRNTGFEVDVELERRGFCKGWSPHTEVISLLGSGVVSAIEREATQEAPPEPNVITVPAVECPTIPRDDFKDDAPPEHNPQPEEPKKRGRPKKQPPYEVTLVPYVDKCACGQPLHYATEEQKQKVVETIKTQGAFINFTRGGVMYSVQRHFATLHGLKFDQLQELVDKGIITKKE